MTSAKSTMFVARKIVPSMEEKDSLRRPEWNDVENSQLLRSGMRGTNGQRANGYKLGDVIGFVEVSARPFGLGQGSDLSDTGRPKIRPVLANLAVKKEVRGSGVGSKLVEACEEKVISWSPTFNEVSKFRNNSRHCPRSVWNVVFRLRASV